MRYYRVYGLNLTVNIALPGPIVIDSLSSDLPTVNVVLGKLPSWLNQTPTELGMPPNWYTSTTTLELDEEISMPRLQVWQIDSRPAFGSRSGSANAEAVTTEIPLVQTHTVGAASPVAIVSRSGAVEICQRGEYFYCLYQDGTTFVVDRLGTEIWATWPEDLTVEDTATYLLGPILGFVLRLRGTVCLHANAIAIGDRVVVLVGTAGAGKSTTAAAFAQKGYAVLSDDVVPLIDRGDRFLIEPAYPRIRLWNESVSALYGAADALPRLVPTHPTWDKRYLDLSQTGYKFQSDPLPLAAIYYLNERSDDRSCPHIAPMTTQEQLITLVTNTYTNYLLDKSQRAQEFELLSRVVKHIPIRQITPHSDVTRLNDLIELVVNDFPV